MLRLLMIVSLVVTLPRPTAQEPHRNALQPFYNRKFDAALRVSEVVRLRFTLSGAATACKHVENLYGYNLLAAQFDGREKAMIETAAQEGTNSGTRTAPGDGAFCATTLRSLQSADDELVVLSEQIAHSGGSAGP